LETDSKLVSSTNFFNTFNTNPSANMASQYFINARILGNSTDAYNAQANCKLFQNRDVFLLILDEIQKLGTIDKVFWSLTCKQMAILLQVKRNSIGNAVYGHSSTALKIRKLNFMLKMAPWFDDLSVRRDPQFQELEVNLRNNPNFQVPRSLRFASVINGFAFCVSCLNYRRTQTIMMHTSNFPTKIPQAAQPGPRTPGRWVRVLTQAARDDASMQQLLRSSLGDEANVEFEAGWTTVPTDPRKLPGYINPNTVRGSRKRKAEAGSSLSGGSASKKARTTSVEESNTGSINTKGKGTAKAQPKFMGAPVAYGDPGVGSSRDHAVIETGLEHLTFLPVNAYGERTSMMCMCERHVIDPLQLVHAALKPRAVNRGGF
jgi:hypothetical protein